MKRTLLLCTLFLVLLQGTVWSQIPKTMSYQGVLKDATGALVADGNYSITFNLYDVATGGTALWTETQSTVSVASGVFSVILGSATTLNPDFTKQYWLGVTVGTDTELSPRIKLTASPYSLNALSVAGSSNTFPSDGNVGIGTTSPTSQLHVEGSGDTSIRIETTATAGTGASLRLKRNQTGKTREWWVGNSQTDSDNLDIYDATAAAVRLTIDASGNIGIGTTSPGQLLEVAGTILSKATSGIVSLEGTANAYIQMKDTGASADNKFMQIINDAEVTSFRPLKDDGSLKYTSLTISHNTGNVGIGTTAPGYLLDVAGSARLTGNLLVGPYIYSSDAQEAIHFVGTGVAIKTGGTERMRVDASGNVGIGTTGPTEELDVSGDARIYKDGGALILRTPTLDASSRFKLQFANNNLAPITGDDHADQLFDFYSGFSNARTYDAKVRIFGSAAASWGNYIQLFHTGDSGYGQISTDVGDIALMPAGNVGIGTTSPGGKLHIERSGVGSGWTTPYIRLRNTDATANSYIDMYVGDVGAIGDNAFVISQTSGGSTENFRFVIDENGNVGIGTTSPGQLLDIYSSSGQAITRITGAGGNLSTRAELVLDRTSQKRGGGVRVQGTTDGMAEWWVGVPYNGGSASDLFTIGRHASQPEYLDNAFVTVNSSGNVGIGTTSPSDKLHVYNNTATGVGMTVENAGAGNSILTVKSSATTTYPAFRLMHGSSSYWDFGSDAANNQNFYIVSAMKTGGADRVFSITKDGNVGIGTTSPSDPLAIVRDQDNFTTLSVSNPNTGSSAMARAYVGSANSALFTFAVPNGYTGVTEWAGKSGIYTSTIGGNLVLDARGTSQGIDFYTGGQNAGNLAMVINSSGNVGIGTTSPAPYWLYVAGNAYSDGSWGGSDQRWKKNIHNINNALEKVMRLRGVTFEWRRNDFPQKNFDEGTQIGLIAQEVEQVLPNLVKTDNDGYKAVAYDKMTAVLIQAIQEQQQEIERQEETIDTLAERVALLEAKTELTSR